MSASEGRKWYIKLEAAFKDTVDIEEGVTINHTEMKKILNRARFAPTENDIQVLYLYYNIIYTFSNCHLFF